jgi:hypothetical protein
MRVIAKDERGGGVEMKNDCANAKNVVYTTTMEGRWATTTMYKVDTAKRTVE